MRIQPCRLYSAIFGIMFLSSGIQLRLKCLFSPPNLGSKRSSVKESVHTLFPVQKILTGKTMNFTFFLLHLERIRVIFMGIVCSLDEILCSFAMPQLVVAGVYRFS